MPVFLDQLADALRRGAMPGTIAESAGFHGHDLRLQGLTVAQVVHDYGDVCQSIAELAIENDAPVSATEFGLLNMCLDTAIASALTQFGREHNQATIDSQTSKEHERAGLMSHELRNLLNTALLAFNVLKTGGVGVKGSTGGVLERSLLGATDLIARSLVEISAVNGYTNRKRVGVFEVLNELMPAAMLLANASRAGLVIRPAHEQGMIDIDPQALAAVLMNLIQNAFKFTHPETTVTVRVVGAYDRVLIEIEDECGGLPHGDTEALFEPFEQRAADRSGIGLGLTFCRRVIEANNGRVQVRDLPGSGCIFTVDLPLATAVMEGRQGQRM